MIVTSPRTAHAQTVIHTGSMACTSHRHALCACQCCSGPLKKSSGPPQHGCMKQRGLPHHRAPALLSDVRSGLTRAPACAQCVAYLQLQPFRARNAVYIGCCKPIISGFDPFSDHFKALRPSYGVNGFNQRRGHARHASSYDLDWNIELVIPAYGRRVRGC